MSAANDFRRNVDPSVRRKTNKDLSELNNLKHTHNANKQALEKAEEKLERENNDLDAAVAALEEARNALSAAQEEIDADYLPEGAQPRARIDNRDRLLLVSFVHLAEFIELV